MIYNNQDQLVIVLLIINKNIKNIKDIKEMDRLGKLLIDLSKKESNSAMMLLL